MSRQLQVYNGRLATSSLEEGYVLGSVACRLYRSTVFVLDRQVWVDTAAIQYLERSSFQGQGFATLREYCKHTGGSEVDCLS